MSRHPADQPDLFASAADSATANSPALPPGMVYEREFLSRDEEAHWIALVQSMPLAPMRYKGYSARRRVVSFGGSYDFDANRLNEAAPIPHSLEPLREKAAKWLGIAAADFSQVLVAEYAPGTPLGWHRDVPDFEDVVGISLLDTAVLLFRPYPPAALRRADIIKLEVEPRSIYLLRGASRWAWQHSVAPTRTLRYSITLRTPRRRA